MKHMPFTGISQPDSNVSVSEKPSTQIILCWILYVTAHLPLEINCIKRTPSSLFWMKCLKSLDLLSQIFTYYTLQSNSVLLI
jgi:hypothetical protein